MLLIEVLICITMRTTLTIDDGIAKSLKETAHRTGKSFKLVVNETLRAGLNAGRVAEQAAPYRVTPASLGEVKAGYNLDKALELAQHLEDEELARKMELKK